MLPQEKNSSEPSAQSGLKSHFHFKGIHSPEPHENWFCLHEPTDFSKNNNVHIQWNTFLTLKWIDIVLEITNT